MELKISYRGMQGFRVNDSPVKNFSTSKPNVTNVVMREQFKALGAPSTIIYVEMDKATASTMLTKNGSCAESRVTSLNVLRTCLAEHFGVKYRNYLAPDATGVAPARILIPDFHMANVR